MVPLISAALWSCVFRSKIQHSRGIFLNYYLFSYSVYVYLKQVTDVRWQCNLPGTMLPDFPLPFTTIASKLISEQICCLVFILKIPLLQLLFLIPSPLIYLTFSEICFLAKFRDLAFGPLDSIRFLKSSYEDANLVVIFPLSINCV